MIQMLLLDFNIYVTVHCRETGCSAQQSSSSLPKIHNDTNLKGEKKNHLSRFAISSQKFTKETIYLFILVSSCAYITFIIFYPLTYIYYEKLMCCYISYIILLFHYFKIYYTYFNQNWLCIFFSLLFASHNYLFPTALGLFPLSYDRTNRNKILYQRMYLVNF